MVRAPEPDLAGAGSTLIAQPVRFIVWSIACSMLPILGHAAWAALSVGTRSDALVLAATTLGQCGLVGLVWQVALGSRTIVRAITADLIAVNTLHRRLGTALVFVLLLHPLLLALSSDDFSGTLVPGSLAHVDRPQLAGQVAFGLLAVTWLASLALRRSMSYRTWRRMHLAVYAGVALGLLHGFTVGSSIAAGDMRVYWAALATAALFVFSTRLASALGATGSEYLLKETRHVTRGVRTLTFRALSEPLAPGSGQFVYVQTRRFGEAHPFTVSHVSTSDGDLSITVKASGPFSRGLHALQPGDRAWIDGPYGTFAGRAAAENTPAVFIAGGIGITPFLRAIAERTGRCLAPTALFYANRRLEDAAFVAELETLRATRAMTLVHVLSDASSRIARHTLCELGHVSAPLLARHLHRPLSHYTFFVCGPPPMMHAVTTALAKAGVGPGQIHTERFSL